MRFSGKAIDRIPDTPSGQVYKFFILTLRTSGPWEPYNEHLPMLLSMTKANL